ncbi:porin family protein [Myroides sp. LJL115]
MKKNFLYSFILVVALFFSSSILAQSASPVHIGIKAGANFNEMSSSIKDYNNKSSTGWGAGAMLRVNIKRTYLQTELMYTEKNFKFQGERSQETSTMKNLEVPLLIGYRFIKLPALHLRGFAGGVYTNTIGDNFKTKDITGVFDDFNKDNLGYRVGLGVDILSFTVDVSYDGGFKNVSKEAKTKPHAWMVSLGYFFL